MTSHHSNPVVIQNYTNRGTLGDFSANYQRDLTPKNRVSLSVRHELSRYELPNEQVQQAAGQLQTADNIETMGIVSYEHIFCPQVGRSSRNGSRQCERFLFRYKFDAYRDSATQPLSRRIFQRQPHG